jgi:hypothetical protein
MNDPQKDNFSDIPSERRKLALKQANRFFLVLLVSGLVIGGVLAFGLVKIINKLGLADKPNHPPHFELYKK